MRATWSGPRPESVNVLGHQIVIAWVPVGDRLYASPLNAADNERDLTGTSELDIGRISVRDRGNADAERQTLMHEIVHTILWLTGHDREDDEKEVQAIATGMLATLRANPALCSYLLEGAW